MHYRRIISTVLLITGMVTPMMADANIESGKYGRAQVFDVQRTPAYPVAGQPFTISSFKNPYGNGSDQSGQYTIGETQYIQFEDIDPAPSTCNYEINLYDSGGTLVKRISSGGSIYGLGAEGFLHVSSPGGYGTFVANNAGYALGDSTSYTPTTGQATCDQVEAYEASTTPASEPGQIPTDGDSQETVEEQTPAPPPTPVPTLPVWAALLLASALAALGLRHL